VGSPRDEKTLQKAVNLGTIEATANSSCGGTQCPNVSVSNENRLQTGKLFSTLRVFPEQTAQLTLWTLGPDE